MATTTLTTFANGTASEAARPRSRTLRSIGAVLAGFLAIAVASTASDALMRALGIFPSGTEPMSDSLFLLAAAYRALFGILGTYLAARLAPSKPMQHALALGGIGVVLTTLGAIAMWSVGGHWYAIANILITLPTAFIGGKLRLAQLRIAA